MGSSLKIPPQLTLVCLGSGSGISEKSQMRIKSSVLRIRDILVRIRMRIREPKNIQIRMRIGKTGTSVHLQHFSKIKIHIKK
jgi:hypothetical protein